MCRTRPGPDANATRQPGAQLPSVAVERATVISGESFDAVLAKVAGGVGHPDMSAFARDVVAARTSSDLERIVDAATGPAGLMEMARFDVGEVLLKELRAAFDWRPGRWHPPDMDMRPKSRSLRAPILKLEAVVIPVADVDRVERFYGTLGWQLLDADFAFDNGFGVVRFHADRARLMSKCKGTNRSSELLGQLCVCDLAHFVSWALRIVAPVSAFYAFNLVGFATRQRDTGSIRH